MWWGSQVEVVQPQLLQARIESLRYVFDIPMDFGSDEQLFPGHFAFFDCDTHLLFRVVYFGGIEMVVS